MAAVALQADSARPGALSRRHYPQDIAMPTSTRPPAPEPTPTPRSVPVRIQLTGAQADDKLELLQALLYDRLGQVAASTTLRLTRRGEVFTAEGALKAGPEQLASARLVVAPLPPEGVPLPTTRELLERRLGAWTEPLRLDPREPRIEFTIPRPGWLPWPRLCVCWVRGKLVKRVQLPGGQVLDLPICHARVTVCEVDRWHWLLDRLPRPELLRLREDLLEVIRRRIPLPEPEPEPFFDPLGLPHPGLQRTPFATSLPTPMQTAQRLAPALLQRAGLPASTPLRAALLSEAQATNLGGLQLRDGSAALLRADLLAHFELIRPWFCWLPWLEPWFLYSKQCFAPVLTDEQGRFTFAYVHLCNDGDQPDIYISAEQRLGGVWTPIHQPPVRCHTVWNYRCGDELVVVVSDPRAQPCVPEVPTEPPTGVDRWVMPMAIGGTWIRGTAASGPSQDGWVRPDGLVNYGGLVDAPFGATLGFRQQHALSIPNTGLGGQFYYRWSVRRGTSGLFTRLLDPVTRSYVRDVPGPGVEFPAVLLGPQPNQLFRFKPALFNTADWGISTAGDPAGTQYYWPVDNGLGDIYAARWTTPGSNDAAAAPALADSYQVKLEVFDSLGNVVTPGAGSFQFVLPSHFIGNTLQTRTAAPSEMDGAGFVFTVRVDNSRCSADIAAPALSTGGVVDDCGFLRYTAGSALTLAFDALHPHGRATFSFDLVRGALGVPAAGAGGEVWAASSGAYSSGGNGSFSHAFAVSSLMGPLPGHPGTCDNAAFAASLQVHAKAMNGNARLSGYDAGDLRAFALAMSPSRVAP